MWHDVLLLCDVNGMPDALILHYVQMDKQSKNLINHLYTFQDRANVENMIVMSMYIQI